jgi:hypothetical protein
MVVREEEQDGVMRSPRTCAANGVAGDGTAAGPHG